MKNKISALINYIVGYVLTVAIFMFGWFGLIMVIVVPITDVLYKPLNNYIDSISLDSQFYIVLSISTLLYIYYRGNPFKEY